MQYVEVFPNQLYLATLCCQLTEASKLIEGSLKPIGLRKGSGFPQSLTMLCYTFIYYDNVVIRSTLSHICYPCNKLLSLLSSN